MRLRNIPRAESVLAASPRVLKDPEQFRGAFRQTVFQNTDPLHIEIGMGKGQFLLTLALQNPSVNYIGIERYSSVLLRPVEKLASMQAAGEAVPSNLRFICMDAADISQVFAPGEVDRIYLNFSDPWPKARHARRRLTSLEYLARYDEILSPNGQVEFKTDNRALFDFSLEQIEASPVWTLAARTFDLHHDPLLNQGNIMTEYEEKFSSMDHPICKLIARRSR
nr:tRNA (guanosine(46)-N7)-methyltransferase TrmB [Massilistercora timonensis]